MPYKDPEVRRQKQKQYSKSYAQRQKAVSGICSVPGCKNAPPEGRKMCESCRAYHHEYKKKYREKRSKPKGSCTNSDCMNPARSGFKLCERCNERSKTKGKTVEAREKRREWNRVLKDEVVQAYGGQCECCGEDHPHFLSLDHIEGYSEGPRKGFDLYRWIKRNDYPNGFRVLCMSCNFALGHHGYCPHGDLTQESRMGKKNSKGLYTEEEKRKKREYWIRYKMKVFEAYGGPICTCCGESHHECLSIDHIDGNGAQHRKELTGNPQDGRNIMIWLKKNDFPPGFQVLCINCNFAKGHFGHCPHEDE